MSDNQYGFRKSRSVEDQLLLTNVEVADKVDSGLIVDVILLYVSKAFDVVSHSIILNKLQMLGFGGKLLLWVRDFLVGRTMCVQVAGDVSESKAVNSGVPQGFVLSPVLFLIYVNCIVASLGCCRRAFADDFKLYLSFSRESCISVFQEMMQLQRDLDKICSVSRLWNFHFNISMCVAIRFGGKNLMKFQLTIILVASFWSLLQFIEI